MTKLGRGLRVFAVLCVLATLLSISVITSRAQDSGTPTATEQTTSNSQSQSNATTDNGTEAATTPTATEPAPSPTDAGVQATQPPVTETETSSPPTSDTPTDQGTEPSSTPTTTGNSSSNATNDLQAVGTPGAGSSASASPSATETGTVSFSAYLCDSVDAASKPADNCTPADGVVFNVDGANNNSATTGADGSASVTANVGNSVTVEFGGTPPSNSSLYGSAAENITVKAGDNTLDPFIFLTNTATGKVQVVNVACPTTGATRTEWRIIEPNTKSMMAAARLACGPNAGASFTFAGGGLGSGSLTVVTDSSGTWKGELPPGTYTITDDATGSSNTINVSATGISVATAIDYTHVSNTGTLAIQIYACPASADSVEISVSGPNGTAPGVDPSCQLTNGSVTIDGANAISVPGGAFNLTTIPEGSYTLESLGQSASFSIVTGEKTYAVVVHHVAMGSVAAQAFSCAEPVSTDQDTTDPRFWQQNCTSPVSGLSLSLSNEGGTQATGGDGSAAFNNLTPGSYSISASGAAICAVFVDGADASGGFQVDGGKAVTVTLYTCTHSSDNGGGNNGGNTGGDNGGTNGGASNGNTSGEGDGTGLLDDHAGGHEHAQAQAETVSATTGTTTVSQLPNTGAGVPTGRDLMPLGMALLLLALAAGAVGLKRRRRAA